MAFRQIIFEFQYNPVRHPSSPNLPVQYWNQINILMFPFDIFNNHILPAAPRSRTRQLKHIPVHGQRDIPGGKTRS